MKNKKGKTVAKQNLPSKTCVVCNRPFTWRKKWENVWDEVTTCSKSCNAKRKQTGKQQNRDDDGTEPCGSHDSAPSPVSSSTVDAPNGVDEHELDPKQALRKQRKEAVKAQKQARKLKRMGIAPSDVGRKPCDLCSNEVDLLIRCTIDETQKYKMVCGRCWPGVSGGVPDGIAQTHPHYRYGGLWKNRNADLKKKVGSGTNNNTNSKNRSDANGTSSPPSTLMEEIEQSLCATADEDSEQ